MSGSEDLPRAPASDARPGPRASRARLARLAETVRGLRPSQVARRVVAALERLGPRPATVPRASWRGLPRLALDVRRAGAGADRETGDGWSFAGAIARPSASGLAWASAPSALQRDHAARAEPVAALARDGRLDDARRWLLAVTADAAAGPAARALRVLALVDAVADGLGDAVPVLLEDAAVVARERAVEGHAGAAVGAALVRAGGAFEGATAARWRALGSATLSRCAREQVLGDGVHVERSPVHHSIVLEHLLVALETAAARGDAPPAGVEGAVARMAHALRALHLPDGELVRWRDGAPGMAVDAPALVAWAERRAGPLAPPRTGPRDFPDAGLAIVESLSGADAVTLVAAPPCAAGLPAHGHADALAYEAVLGGTRVVSTARTVDDAAGRERDRARRPGAFAGLLLDGEAHADPYGAFGLGARGWTRRLGTGEARGWRWASAHAGFPGAAHAAVRRLVATTPLGAVVVMDEVVGRGARVDAFAPLAPGLRAALDGDGASVVDLAGRRFRLTAPGAEVTEEPGVDALGLGAPVERSVLRLAWRGPFPARRVHAWTTGSAPASVAATPIAGGEVRLVVRCGAGEEVGYVPVGVPA